MVESENGKGPKHKEGDRTLFLEKVVVAMGGQLAPNAKIGSRRDLEQLNFSLIPLPLENALFSSRDRITSTNTGELPKDVQTIKGGLSLKKLPGSEEGVLTLTEVAERTISDSGNRFSMKTPITPALEEAVGLLEGFQIAAVVGAPTSPNARGTFWVQFHDEILRPPLNPDLTQRIGVTRKTFGKRLGDNATVVYAGEVTTSDAGDLFLVANHQTVSVGRHGPDLSGGSKEFRAGNRKVEKGDVIRVSAITSPVGLVFDGAHLLEPSDARREAYEFSQLHDSVSLYRNMLISASAYTPDAATYQPIRELGAEVWRRIQEQKMKISQTQEIEGDFENCYYDERLNPLDQRMILPRSIDEPLVIKLNKHLSSLYPESEKAPDVTVLSMSALFKAIHTIGQYSVDESSFTDTMEAFSLLPDHLRTPQASYNFLHTVVDARLAKVNSGNDSYTEVTILQKAIPFLQQENNARATDAVYNIFRSAAEGFRQQETEKQPLLEAATTALYKLISNQEVKNDNIVQLVPHIEEMKNYLSVLSREAASSIAGILFLLNNGEPLARYGYEKGYAEGLRAGQGSQIEEGVSNQEASQGTIGFRSTDLVELPKRTPGDTLSVPESTGSLFEPKRQPPHETE